MPSDRPPSPRCTEKERFYRGILEDAEGRGIPLAQVAVERDIPAGTLSWWRGEIRRREALRRGVTVKGRNSRAEGRIDFVPVETGAARDVPPAEDRPASGPDFEVLLPGGAVVRVPADFREASLTRLVRAVSAAC